MLLVDIAQAIAQAGVATAGTDMFITGRVDEPDEIIVLFEYESNDVGHVFGGESHESMNVQILARGKTYRAAYDRVVAAVDALRDSPLVTVQRKSSVFPLRVDEEQRHELVCNVRVWNV